MEPLSDEKLLALPAEQYATLSPEDRSRLTMLIDNREAHLDTPTPGQNKEPSFTDNYSNQLAIGSGLTGTAIGAYSSWRDSKGAPSAKDMAVATANHEGASQNLRNAENAFNQGQDAFKQRYPTPIAPPALPPGSPDRQWAGTTQTPEGTVVDDAAPNTGRARMNFNDLTSDQAAQRELLRQQQAPHVQSGTINPAKSPQVTAAWGRNPGTQEGVNVPKHIARQMEKEAAAKAAAAKLAQEQYQAFLAEQRRILGLGDAADAARARFGKAQTYLDELKKRVPEGTFPTMAKGFLHGVNAFDAYHNAKDLGRDISAGRPVGAALDVANLGLNALSAFPDTALKYASKVPVVGPAAGQVSPWLLRVLGPLSLLFHSGEVQ